MTSALPENWEPWRSRSHLGDRRPTRKETAHAVSSGNGREDVLPYPRDEQNTGLVRILIIGINPSPWTAAVNAPFARPGNRFWASLEAAGILDRRIDASRGLSPADERILAERGLGITNLVSRPSARADELSRSELRDGGSQLVERIRVIRPQAVAVVGITAFRDAFAAPRTIMGLQRTGALADWPDDVQLWVLPNPSGLNAHENIESLAQKWREVWEATVPPAVPPATDTV
ncbi:mismatch-specific DNA-glycosylase [Kocuria sp. TGY1127_2]|uniref:mismatch-specific DNA-glycosylase n=1 Tax=Kocuria sp. TGY1127_2 TaxID=2711328 RepID=UPI0015C09348|nr:mismatch-specific DNA-glycosylase [Kocuria sp. TGY1127_2]